jgi:hypothetical protein
MKVRAGVEETRVERGPAGQQEARSQGLRAREEARRAVLEGALKAAPARGPRAVAARAAAAPVVPAAMGAQRASRTQ